MSDKTREIRELVARFRRDVESRQATIMAKYYLAQLAGDARGKEAAADEMAALLVEVEGHADNIEAAVAADVANLQPPLRN